MTESAEPPLSPGVRRRLERLRERRAAAAADRAALAANRRLGLRSRHAAKLAYLAARAAAADHLQQARTTDDQADALPSQPEDEAA
jgi:hypothetical protein